MSMTSPLTWDRTALAIIRLAVLQIPIGLMPGFFVDGDEAAGQ